ncbi:MAG: hypothetical protein IPK75_12675 [Acidobacteria bacterium]|nr:hypothetical protein [Acidobacteriota bacterium]
MAKDINDTEDEDRREAVPATGGDIRSMLASYEEKQDEKKEIAESQKAELKEFEATHGVPVWISKIIRKFDQIEDAANRSHAWNALMRSGTAMGFDQQPDMFDPPKVKEGPKRARANA